MRSVKSGAAEGLRERKTGRGGRACSHPRDRDIKKKAQRAFFIADGYHKIDTSQKNSGLCRKIRKRRGSCSLFGNIIIQHFLRFVNVHFVRFFGKFFVQKFGWEIFRIFVAVVFVYYLQKSRVVVKKAKNPLPIKEKNRGGEKILIF